MTPGDAGPTETEKPRWATTLLILVATALHTAALLNAKPLQSANDRSRWCTVWSLVEKGTFQIDEIRQRPGWDSIDIIRDDGHFYSTKPPLLSLAVAGVTWCVQRTTGWTLIDQTHAVTTVVLFVVNILPFALSLILLSRLLDRVAETHWCRWLIVAAAAFATLLSPFLMTLNNHTVAAAGAVVCLFALERVLSGERPTGWTFALCGAAAAWTCCNELPAAAFGLATFVLAWRRSVRQTLCWYAPAAIVPLAAFVATNVIATGSWKPTYADYGSEKYRFVVDGVPSYWMDPQGVDRNLDSPLTYFVHGTIGHHGILSLTPLFLLSLAGWFLSGSLRNRGLRTMIRAGAGVSLIVIGFYLTRTQNYNYGGVSCALRWALWLIPFWLLALVPVLDRAAHSVIGRGLVLLLLAASIVSAWIPIPNPWQPPWLFRQMEALGWIDYSETPPPLPHTLWTWFPSVPAPSQSGDDEPWIEFTSHRPDGGVVRRRLVSRVRNAKSKPELTDVEILEANGNADLRSVRRLLIDAARLQSGASPAEFLRWSDPATTSAQQQADFTFVRGLPLKHEYHPGFVRYLKTPIRRDAFRCQRAASQVEFATDDGVRRRYRCDLWLCDELPFGVAQVEFQVSDPENGAMLNQERWTVSACNPPVAGNAILSTNGR
jgi:hypothetical protein